MDFNPVNTGNKIADLHRGSGAIRVDVHLEFICTKAARRLGMACAAVQFVMTGTAISNVNSRPAFQ